MELTVPAGCGRTIASDWPCILPRMFRAAFGPALKLTDLGSGSGEGARSLGFPAEMPRRTEGEPGVHRM